MAEINKITRAESKMLRKAIQNVAEEHAKVWFKLCEMIHRVYYSGIGDELAPVYEGWGFESWEDYVEEELGCHITTANSMRRCYHFFGVQMKGTWKKQILSRQRMCVLADSPKVDKGNLNEWIRKAINLPICALESELFDRTDRRVSASFSMTMKNKTIVDKGIDALMDQIDKDGECLFETRGEALASKFKPKKKGLKVA